MFWSVKITEKCVLYYCTLISVDIWNIVFYKLTTKSKHQFKKKFILKNQARRYAYFVK